MAKEHHFILMSWYLQSHQPSNMSRDEIISPSPCPLMVQTEILKQNKIQEQGVHLWWHSLVRLSGDSRKGSGQVGSVAPCVV